MINLISIYLFGVMTISIPIVLYYIKVVLQKHATEIARIKTELDSTLVELNKLHNAAVSKYQGIDSRIAKLETTMAAREYGRKL